MDNLLTILFGVVLALTFVSCEELNLRYLSKSVPETADQDPSVPSISVNGALLHSEAFGNPDSTIIVCIHGDPGSDYRYMLNYKDLAGYGYRAVFYDQRGSGLSQRFSKKFYVSRGTGAIDLMYNDLSWAISFYRTHPDQKVFPAGRSWGAMLATAYVGKYPNAVQGLAIGEPGGINWDDVMEFLKTPRALKISSEGMNDATFLDQFIKGKEDQREIPD
jgi:proline iminopeptidase